jgi:putative transposase
METTLVLDALTMAVWRRRPKGSVIIHSDQGSQFGSDEFSRWCKENRLSPSMSRRGNCWDKAVVESFFSNLKSEKKSKRRFTKQGRRPGLKSLSTLKASTIQFGVTNILTNSAPLSSRDVNLHFEECLQN